MLVRHNRSFTAPGDMLGHWVAPRVPKELCPLIMERLIPQPYGPHVEIVASPGDEAHV